MIVKRNSLRYFIKAKGFFKSESGDSKVFEGKVLDLGYLGLSIFLKESVPSNIIINFDISADFLVQHLIGKGKIVYVTQQKTIMGDGFRVGVEFMEVDKNIIIEFINENQRMINEERKRIEAGRRNRQGASGCGPF